MSGSEWNRYLNGGTSQYNFSYKSNIPTAPSPVPTPPQSSPSAGLMPTPLPNVTNKKNNNTKINILKINKKNTTQSGGKRKSRRRITKRK